MRKYFYKNGFEPIDFQEISREYFQKLSQLYQIFRSRLDTHLGVAYEVHNLFKKIFSKKDEYMEIINDVGDEEKDVGDEEKDVGDEEKKKDYNETLDTLYTYVGTEFGKIIFHVFSDEKKTKEMPLLEEKAKIFITLLQRARLILKFDTRTHHELLLHGFEPFTNEEKTLVGNSVNFVSKQSINFKREYILSFLDESCTSQITGSDPVMSCSRGIAERFVTAIGSAVEILCKEENEECNDVYKKLNKLMNPKFDIATQTSNWFEKIAEDETYKNSLPTDADERIKVYKDYIKQQSLDSDGRTLQDTYIDKYIEKFRYAFEDKELQLGGKKIKQKSKKSKKAKKQKNKKTKKQKSKKAKKQKSK
jgi:hypothetical protein